MQSPLGLITQYFSTPCPSPLLSTQSKVHRPAGTLPLAEKSNPHPCAVSPGPPPVWGKRKGELEFSWFWTSACTVVVSKDERLHLGPVALISYSDTRQLGSLPPSPADPHSVIMSKIPSFTI